MAVTRALISAVVVHRESNDELQRLHVYCTNCSAAFLEALPLPGFALDI